jgi:hypothetical protein
MGFSLTSFLPHFERAAGISGFSEISFFGPSRDLSANLQYRALFRRLELMATRFADGQNFCIGK